MIYYKEYKLFWRYAISFNLVLFKANYLFIQCLINLFWRNQPSFIHYFKILSKISIAIKLTESGGNIKKIS